MNDMTTIVCHGPVTVVQAALEATEDFDPLAVIVDWLKGALDNPRVAQIIDTRMSESSMAESPTDITIQALIDLGLVWVHLTT